MQRGKLDNAPGWPSFSSLGVFPKNVLTGQPFVIFVWHTLVKENGRLIVTSSITTGDLKKNVPLD